MAKLYELTDDYLSLWESLGDPEDLACPERAEYKALLAELDEQNTEDDEDE